MASRSGYRRVDPGSPLVDLDAVFADDAEVDRIAEQSAAGAARSGHVTSPGGRVPPGSGDPLMDLFRTWRQELTAVPLPPVPDVHGAIGGAPDTVGSGQRSVRAVLAVAAAIAALLVGSATVGSRHAEPDSALWAVTQVLWPDHAKSVTSRQNVQVALQQAQAALATGRTQEAQLALLRAAMELGKVDEGDGRDDMADQVDSMWRVAAPQGVSSTSLAPELLAGEPAGQPPAVAPSSFLAAGRTGAPAPTSQRAAATTPAAASPTAAPAAGAPQSGLPAAAEDQSGPALVADGPVPPAAGDQGVVSPPAPAVAAPSSVAGPAVIGPPAPQPSVPAAPPSTSAVPGAAEPPPVVDPVAAPSTSPTLTPPPPSPVDPNTGSTSPDTTTSAAPPAPAPAPAPTTTEIGPQTTTDTAGTGATDATASDQQVSVTAVGFGPVGFGPVGFGPVGFGPVGVGPVGVGPVGERRGDAGHLTRAAASRPPCCNASSSLSLR